MSDVTKLRTGPTVREPARPVRSGPADDRVAAGRTRVRLQGDR
jgi:hypothetical protein